MLNPTNFKQVRSYFYTTWLKYKNKVILTDLEIMMCDCIMMHPEYHHILNDATCLDKDFYIEHNPFIHFSLHLSIIEQVKIDQPNGITAIYNIILQKYKDEHKVQHIMIECLQKAISDNNSDNFIYFQQQYLINLHNAC